MIRAKMIQKLLGVFLIILAIAVSIEASSSDCPNPNVPNCKKSELLCISAPEPEDHCSKLECIKKKYQSPMNPSKKCKAFCPLYCGENHVTCPGPMDENGCSLGDVCVARTPCLGQNCETHCPIYCNEGFKLCSGGVEPSGCPIKDYCIPNMIGNCTNHCPCPAGQFTCSEDADENGCPLPPICVPMNDPSSCPSYDAVILLLGCPSGSFCVLRTASVFNDTDCKIQKMPRDSSFAAAALLNGRPLVCGGTEFIGQWHGDCYQLLKNGQWEYFGNLGSPRSGHTAIDVTGEMIWIAGGGVPRIDSSYPFTNSTKIIYANGTIASGPDLPEPASDHCGVKTENGLIYLTGGQPYTPQDRVWIFNSALEFIGFAPNMNNGRIYHACNTIYSQNHEGRQVILVAGGQGKMYNEVIPPEILDFSVAGSPWTSLPPLPATLSIRPGVFQMPGQNSVLLLNGETRGDKDYIEMFMNDGEYSYKIGDRPGYTTRFLVALMVPRDYILCE